MFDTINMMLVEFVFEVCTARMIEEELIDRGSKEFRDNWPGVQWFNKLYVQFVNSKDSLASVGKVFCGGEYRFLF